MTSIVRTYLPVNFLNLLSLYAHRDNTIGTGTPHIVLQTILFVAGLSGLTEKIWLHDIQSELVREHNYNKIIDII